MGKYFLGSVGKAEAFKRGADGELTLAFVSKTLTDSGLNISTTKDDVRAGEGAPVQFSFYHDANVEITLTDVLWKKEYLTAQLGAQFKSGAENEDYITETISGEAGKLTLTKDIKDMPIPCDGTKKLVWYTEQGQDNWRSAVPADKVINDASVKEGVKYCVRYLSVDSRAKVAEITSSIIPEELFLIITAPIFAGDACAASRGKAAGHITFEVPRFQLNGSQEFTMNMSQNQTMSLAGTAMASESESCETNAGKLLRIIEVIDNEDWYSDITELIVDEETAINGGKPVVYGLKRDGSLISVPNTKLMKSASGSGDWSVVGDEYTFTTGTIYLTIADDKGAAITALKDKVIIPA